MTNEELKDDINKYVRLVEEFEQLKEDYESRISDLVSSFKPKALEVSEFILSYPLSSVYKSSVQYYNLTLSNLQRNSFFEFCFDQHCRIGYYRYEDDYTPMIVFPRSYLFTDDWKQKVITEHNEALEKQEQSKKLKELEEYQRLKEKFENESSIKVNQ